MVDSACWRRLDDRGPDLVLCLDFPGGRAEAGFAELAAHAPVPAGFLHLGPTGFDEGSLRSLAGRWVREALGLGRDVLAVLGFCAGTALATRVADAVVEAGQASPEVVLFDAVTVTGATLGEQFTEVIESSAEHLTEDELTGAHAWRERVLDRYPDDPPRIAAELAGRYDELMASVADRLGLGARFHAELTAGFTAYLDYLVLAGAGGLDSRTGTPLFVSSRDHPLDIEVPRQVRLDVDHEDLLRDAEAHELVAGLLRGAHR